MTKFLQCLTGLSRRTRRVPPKPNPISRPIVPRTLLPKAPSSSDQVFQVSNIADSDKTGVISSPSSSVLKLSQSFLSTTSSGDNTPTKPTVITMAPTEIRKRRIVPTPVPVAVPCGTLKIV